jgi:hypothetical protein
MHRALAIDELRAHICAFADAHDRTVLARVNHAFAHSALDALWYRLDQIAPLLALTPSTFLEQSLVRDFPFYLYVSLCAQSGRPMS